MALHEVYAHYIQTGDICEVVFFDRASADAFAKAGNDDVQADLYWVESVSLIDDYGVPFSRRELPEIWPHHFATAVQS